MPKLTRDEEVDKYLAKNHYEQVAYGKTNDDSRIWVYRNHETTVIVEEWDGEKRLYVDIDDVKK